MRILVTGGAGFIGSATVDTLLAAGHDVVVLDDLSTGDRANLDARVQLIVADIADGESLRAAFDGQRFDAVVHFAAKTKVVESMERPDLYRRVLVGGTKNVLRLARATGATSFVNISTGGAMYGETPRAATEGTPAAPASPYGQFKLLAEDLASMSASLRVVTLRLANVYGPRQRSDLEGGVISIFLDRWIAGAPVTVFGDGGAERDYIYVDDVAEAVGNALRATVSGIFNIGTGRAVSVNELIALLSAQLGAPAGVSYVPPRPGELRRAVLDAAKAERVGLLPRTTPLEDGLALTIDAVRAAQTVRV
jgi:UDP-glucose 4-epimerase